jgi:hypothetical protein
MARVVRARRDPRRDLVHVTGRGDASADVDELPYPRISNEQVEEFGREAITVGLHSVAYGRG